MNYYNENNPFAAEWLRNLITEGLIADGVVDSRSIVDVTADDVREFTQCHFFAGLGGWCEACRIAGVSSDYPIWTGSCPCQPFSVAGKGKGTDDERHLWPEFMRLIRECRPGVVCGEQVASTQVIGRVQPKRRRAIEAELDAWFDRVCSDLEDAHYTCGAADLPAACVGAPHIRQRLWWVAHSRQSRRLPGSGDRCGPECSRSEHRHDSQRRCGDGCGVPNATGPRRQGAIPESHEVRGGSVADRGLRHAVSARLEGHAGHGDGCDQSGRVAAIEYRPVAAAGSVDLRIPDAAQGRQRELRGASDAGSRRHDDRSGSTDQWSDYEWVWCRDGKARRLEPGLEPLVDGPAFRLADGRSRADTSRREILHAIGNAIVPQVAAEFLQAALP